MMVFEELHIECQRCFIFYFLFNLMNIKTFFFILLLFNTSICIADNAELLVSYRGPERTSLSNCADTRTNKTFILQWNVIHTKITGSSFEGNGSNFAGEFKMSGKISGNKTSGSIVSYGVNIWGYPWSGSFEGTLDADRYTVITKGRFTGGCYITSEVEATKE
jgi:hypothetical protein